MAAKLLGVFVPVVQAKDGTVHAVGCNCADVPSTSKANSAAYVTEWQRIFGGKAKEASA